MRNTWERSVRFLGVFTLGTFFITAMTPLSNAIGRRMAIVSDHLEPADAIIVLGSGVWRNGTLDTESMRRTIAGIEFYKRGLAPILVLSGPGRSGSPEPAEAQVRAKLAEAMGIPSVSILLEERAHTTFEESVHISAVLHQRAAEHVLLVTDSLHMRRALRVFEHAGLKVQPAVSADYPAALNSSKDRLWLAMRIAQESAAMIYYRLAGYM
jgi:uncharacterized SAM-binding protein YcdF (DUF218 family)